MTVSIALMVLLNGCNSQNSQNSQPSGKSVSAAGVLGDLHLSTAPPAAVPPLLPPSRSIAVLARPVVIKRSPPAPGPGGRNPSREPGSISLNFEKASLRSVIDAVLGDALGLAYSVDERVDGVVTLISPQKLSRDDALEVLDGVLRLNGATLIKTDKLYRVVLAANARQNLSGPTVGAEQPGYGVTVYVARHSAAASLQKLIEPLYQIPGALASDGDHNLLLITGSAEERRALSEAARLFDQDWLSSQSVGIYPLAHARPKALSEELRALFAPGGAAANGGATPQVRVSAIERLNAVMVVSPQPESLDLAGEWIERLDQAGAGDRRLHTYSVRYAKVQTVAKLLARLFSAGSGDAGNSALPSGTVGTRLSGAGAGGVGAASGAAAVTPAPAGVMPSSGQGSGLGSNDRSLASESDSSDGDAAVADSGNGPKIIADIPSHSLLIMANQAEYAVIEEALTKLDAKPVQVLIEATIVEVTLNKSLQYGVQYFLRGTKLLNQDSSVGFNSSTTVASAGNSGLSGIAPGFNGVLGSIGNPSVIISALNSVTDSKVLSSPQLLVTDSHEAMLKVGTQTPLLTQQATGTLTANAAIVQSVEYHDTGVILRVLPRANDADMVSLDIAQEVSQVVPSSAVTLTPNIDQRRIESSVTVQSGQTVMLGGLISENNSIGNNGVPLLDSLPWIGALFGNRTDSRARTELIIFITPHILRDGSDAQRLSDELISRMQSMKPPGAETP